MLKTDGKSVVLLSGGLDSCVALAHVVDKGPVPKITLGVDYGQRHHRELISAAKISEAFGIPHYTVDMTDLGTVIASGSALVNAAEQLPSNRAIDDMGTSIPRSYVPGRNTILFSIAQSVAEALECDWIIHGANLLDHAGYPDCRPAYMSAWNEFAKVATKRAIDGSPIQIMTPLINFSKADIVKMGLDLCAPLGLTWSCYAGGDHPCGTCDSCIIRADAFQQNGTKDPALLGIG